MNVGIGFVFKLPGHEPAMCLGKLDRLVDHSYGAFGGGRYDDLRAQKSHELAALDAERLGHGDHERIALGCANHGKTDPSISARRLDDRLARLKFSRFFGSFDYPKRQSVLH